jgi:hypothetical protein
LTVLSLFFIANLAFGQTENELEKTSLLDNKLEILVPKAFHKMTEGEYKIKYPNPKRKASLILTDKYLEINLVIDYLVQYDLTNDQVEEFKSAKALNNKLKFEDFLSKDETTSIQPKNLADVYLIYKFH